MRRVPWLFVGALMIWAVFGLAYAVDLREHVSVLSGTPVPRVPLEQALAGGAFYVLAWFGAVLVAPVLVIAEALAEIPRAVGARS